MKPMRRISTALTAKRKHFTHMPSSSPDSCPFVLALWKGLDRLSRISLMWRCLNCECVPPTSPFIVPRRHLTSVYHHRMGPTVTCPATLTFHSSSRGAALSAVCCSAAGPPHAPRYHQKVSRIQQQQREGRGGASRRPAAQQQLAHSRDGVPADGWCEWYNVGGKSWV